MFNVTFITVYLGLLEIVSICINYVQKMPINRYMALSTSTNWGEKWASEYTFLLSKLYFVSYV